MNCTPNSTDIRTAIENHKAFYPVKTGQSFNESWEYLQHTQQNFDKIDNRYVFIPEDLTLRTTVTSKISKGQTPKGAYAESSAIVGTVIHDVMYGYGQYILSQIENMSVGKVLSDLSGITRPDTPIPNNYGKTIDNTSLDNLFNLVKQQVQFTYEQQQIINKKTGSNAVPKIGLEFKVIDPRGNMGGTIDFLAILSDNTAIIKEFTTIQTKSEQFDESGNLLPEINLVHSKSKEKVKLQMSEYGRILRQFYGVKGIASSRMIPIRTYSEWDVKQKTFKPSISRIAGPNQDSRIEEITPFVEKTGFEKFDEFILSIEKRIEKLESDKEKNIESKPRLQARINSLTALKTELIVKRSINNVVEYAKSLNKQLEKIEDISDIELLEILDELRLIQGLGEATYELRKYMGKDSEESALMEASIGQIMSLIRDRIEDVKIEMINNRVNRLVEEATGYEIIDEAGNLVPVAAEGFFGKYLYRLSEFSNPMFKTLKAKLDEAQYNKRLAIEKITKEVIATENNVYEYLNSTGKTWSDFIKIMINPETDNFWSKVDKKYYQDSKALEASKLHERWVPQEWYSTYLKNEEQVYQKQLEQKYPPETVVAMMTEWMKENSLELNSDGTAKYPNAWRKAMAWGKLILKEDSIVYSKEFLAIQAVPQFLEYYEMFEKYNKEFRKLLGVEYSKLPNNFLPNIRKHFSERIDEMGLSGVKAGIIDWAKDFSIREEDTSDDGSYENRTSIPRFYLNPFKDKDSGTILTGEKSYQLGRSLLIFAKMAHNFHEMSKIEAEVLMLREALLSSEEIQTKNGKPLTNLLGNTVSIKIPNTGLDEIYQNFIDMYIYGVNIKPVIGDKSGQWEKVLMKAKEYFSLKTLGLSFIAAGGSYLAAKTQAYITGKTGIYYDEDQYTNAIKASAKDRKNFLALSAFFDPMGHRYGTIRLEEKTLGEAQLKDTSQKGWVNQYINARLLMQPFALGDQHVEEVITYAMAQNYYVDENGNLKKIKFPEQKEMYKDRLVVNLFEFKDETATLKLSEEHSKRVMIQFRNAVRDAQAGIKGTISEEDKAMWQGQIMGQLLMNFKSWMPAVMFERFGKVKYKDTSDTLYMGRYIAILQEFGNTNHNGLASGLEFKTFLTSIVFPKMLQFVGHLLSLHSIGGKFKPYTIKDDGTVYAMYEKWLLENPQYQGRVSYEEFRDIQQKQLKAVIVELRILLTFVALTAMSMGDWDDDGEKDYRKYLLTRKLVSLALKAQQEMWFMFSPTEFANLTKNPIPVVGLVSDAVKTMKNTADELFDVSLKQDVVIGQDFMLTNNQDEIDNKNILSYTHTWWPGLGGLAKTLDFFSDDVQYSK